MVKVTNQASYLRWRAVGGWASMTARRFVMQGESRATIRRHLRAPCTSREIARLASDFNDRAEEYQVTLTTDVTTLLHNLLSEESAASDMDTLL